MINNLLKNNIIVFSISLFLAITTWYILSDNTSFYEERILKIPVKYKNLSPNLFTKKHNIIKVKINFFKNSYINSFNEDKIKAKINLENINNSGIYELPVDIDFPFYLKVLDYNPKKIKVFILKKPLKIIF